MTPARMFTIAAIALLSSAAAATSPPGRPERAHRFSRRVVVRVGIVTEIRKHMGDFKEP
jgi:hypothetical protein